MARKIRIHKDITFRWRVNTNGSKVSLLGRDLCLYITDSFGNKTILDFSVTDENLITTVFYGRVQRSLGDYVLTLVENACKDGSTAVDAVNAVTLVSRTEQETPEDTYYNLTADTIDLEADLYVGGRGASAYEIWLAEGHTGTVAEFLESLKGEKGDKGDKGEQGEKGDEGEKGKTGDKGTDGVSIVGIRQVVESKESGGENVFRVTLSNGAYNDFTVRNGQEGKIRDIVDNLNSTRTDAALSARQGSVLSGMARAMSVTLQDLENTKGKVKQIFSEGNNYYPLLIANNSSMVDSHLTTLGASYYSDQILFNPYLGTLKVGGQLMAYKPYVDNKLSEKLDKPTQYLDDSLISPNIARSSDVSAVASQVSGLSTQVTNLATENTEQDGRLTALEQRPIVDKDLTERVTDLENDRKYNHNLGNTRIKSLSVDEPIKVCDAPMVLIGSGAPSATNVPQNWDKETMGEWFGIPNFIGQMYVNISASSNALYVAVNDTAVSGWKTA